MVSWKALNAGTARIWVHKRLLLWLYLINMVFAVVLVFPLRNLVSTIAETDLADDFLSRFNIDAFLDIWAEHSLVFKTLGFSAVGLGIVYLVASIFLTGGIVATLAADNRVTLRRFITNAARYFWRFLRLFVALAIVLGSVVAANLIWLKPYVDTQRDLVTTGRASFLLRSGNVIVILIVAALILMVFDYAKIRTVVQDRRSAVMAVLSALGFTLRRPCRTVFLFTMNLILAGLLVVAYLVVENLFSGATIASIIGLFALQQLFILGRIWMKLSFFASQLELHQATMAAVHKPRTIPAPRITVPPRNERPAPAAV